MSGQTHGQTHPVILCGGSGTRLWPLSRNNAPKQFLDLLGRGETMIQATARRVAALTDVAPVVVTNAAQAILVNRQLPQAKVLLEPKARNTAAAIGYAAIMLLKEDPEAVMVVLPCDHFFAREPLLTLALGKAVELAKETHMLITLGIEPTFPHPKLGYIKPGDSISEGLVKVAEFREKPGEEIARQFISEGYRWNSGMFVWRAQDFLDAMQQTLPQTWEGLKRIDADEFCVRDEYPKFENISVDFGVLQRLPSRIGMVQVSNLGWEDIGSWDIWSSHFPKDPNGNVLVGDAVVMESSDCLVRADKGQVVALLGVKDLAVIQHQGAVLVVPKGDVSRVGELVSQILTQVRPDVV